MKLVVIESPYSGDIARNREYAIRCMQNCVNHGEVPFASHLLYTQALDDTDRAQRQKGIEFGYHYWDFAEVIRFHLDYGWSHGMSQAFERAVERGYTIEICYIGTNDEPLTETQYGAVNAEHPDYTGFQQ